MERKSFVGHLEDLRGCVLKSAIGLVVGVVVSFVFVSFILEFLSRPYFDYLSSRGLSTTMALRSLSPADTLLVTFKAAILFGLGLVSPWIAYQLWRFVSPALYKDERKRAVIFCAFVFVFFFIGLAFAYFVVLPIAIRFFYEYTIKMGIAPDWAIANYYGLVIAFMACFGIIFELPVAVTILTWLGIITSQDLTRYRKHAIVCIFIAAALLTPPDVITQLMMGIPLIALYEVSILVSKIIDKGRNKITLKE